jgi:hypothetical protein
MVARHRHPYNDTTPREEQQVLLIAAASIWCWTASLDEHGSCVYSREQCFEIVRLRRATDINCWFACNESEHQSQQDQKDLS